MKFFERETLYATLDDPSVVCILARMKLYYSPHACSISPHIALHEAGLPFEAVRVDLASKTLPDGTSFTAVNPKGYVPALIMEDGHLLTEGVVIIQHIADQVPEKKLAPKAGTYERLRLQEWLNFIATELHKGYSPFYAKDANDAYKSYVSARLLKRMDILSEGLGDKPYLMGDFTVADGYALYALRSWGRVVKRDLPANIVAWKQRISERPAVKAALATEGLT